MKIDRFDSIIIAISKVPLCIFEKSTGSMEPVEPVLTTALVYNNLHMVPDWSSGISSVQISLENFELNTNKWSTAIWFLME